jgi:hypothetical protein
VKKIGARISVERHRRVLSWWRPVENGAFAFFMGPDKPIEFEKSRTAIAVASLDKVPAVSLSSMTRPRLVGPS